MAPTLRAGAHFAPVFVAKRHPYLRIWLAFGSATGTKWASGAGRIYFVHKPQQNLLSPGGFPGAMKKTILSVFTL